MARPVKWRRVEFIPDVKTFVPEGISKNDLDENILRIEELEAMRLKDLNGYDQEVCAERMEVSRQTFQRILNNGRAKVIDSLINGKALRIEGGNFTRNICPVRCQDCGNEWRESYENYRRMHNGTYQCPYCGSNNVVCINREIKRFCRGNCWRHGRRG